jgi:hypothetical protein
VKLCGSAARKISRRSTERYLRQDETPEIAAKLLGKRVREKTFFAKRKNKNERIA